ncbi:MAG: amidohydrolase family protein [Syntrophaceae bacterium]|nr:amidohydrolase family protein [Syntrophaceae bacterium]
MGAEDGILIQGARIVDGSGNPYYHGDIAIRGGKIVQIRPKIEERGFSRVIPARHLTASPGFIDPHSHDDCYVIVRPSCDDKVLQGVTTCAIGNCGFSMAPLLPPYRDEMKEALRVMGSSEVPEDFWRFQSFGDYLDRVEKVKPGINLIPSVGHQAVRIAVMGSALRAPSGSELEKMKTLVEEAMEAGAFGFSTGLIYAPGNFAQSEEIVELAKAVTPCGGIYTTHLRSEGDFEMEALDEAFRVGREAGVRVHIAHHKVIGRNNWGKSRETLRRIAGAREEEIEVTCDQYPYHAGSTYLASALPPRILADGESVFVKKLQDPAIRREIVEEIEERKAKGPIWDNWIKAAGFQGVVISISPNHPEYVGKSIEDIARGENKSPYDVIFDLIVEEKKATVMILFVMDEEDIERIMKSPFTMVGTDGIPGFGISRVHPRQTGTFPRVLGRYCREKGVLILEEAVRKMTSFPAQTFRLKHKGLLREGYDADLVLFDDRTIIDRSTFEDPNQSPEGVPYVLVNGQIAVEGGKVTGAASGKVLRAEN